MLRLESGRNWKSPPRSRAASVDMPERAGRRRTSCLPDKWKYLSSLWLGQQLVTRVQSGAGVRKAAYGNRHLKLVTFVQRRAIMSADIHVAHFGNSDQRNVELNKFLKRQNRCTLLDNELLSLVVATITGRINDFTWLITLKNQERDPFL